MMTRRRQSGKHGFTIIELLTVMSIIIILIGLLVPALSQVKRYAREVKQRAQFHSIEIAMDLFETEHGVYPDSSQDGSDGIPYCGAMKLAEAMVGQDLLGFHPNSTFRSDLMDATGTTYLYSIPGVAVSQTDVDEMNRKSRKGPYLQLDNANATRLTNIYGTGASLGVFNAGNLDQVFVLSDVYVRTMPTGSKVGMPILYYRAYSDGTVNPSSNPLNPNSELSPGRIYRHENNDELVKLGAPWIATANPHPIDEAYTPAGAGSPPGLPESFYWRINNDNIPLDNGMPYKSNSYILLSAGEDGLYGTSDDLYNFQKQ